MSDTQTQPEAVNEPTQIESRGERPMDLAPLNIIRSETVLSKLPVHNLAKKGRVDIQIVDKDEQGEIKLKWEVSYSDRYGQARQLAYKLDTLVVNRKIDDTARPLPPLLKIGSLRQVCKDLDLDESGDSINRIKKAFRQNAFAGITAKLTFKAVDGREIKIDASDTRYGVIFTGEKLPNGARADAVYIALHGFYLEVLNNAPTRPLDYDYLKFLSPAAQRFYEIISFKIYAAIKHKNPRAANIAYSDYCTFSAQQRYYDYDHFKKQMYKVHIAHIKSGYITKASYEETTDKLGKIDWTMYYTPGPKALAEYRAYHRRSLNKIVDAIEAPARPARMLAPAPAEQGTETPALQTAPVLKTPATEVVQFFHQLMHDRENFEPRPKELEQATELLTRHTPERARFIIAHAVASARSTNFKPEHFGAVLTYEAEGVKAYETRQRELRERAEREAQEKAQREREEAARQAIDARLAALTEQERHALETKAKQNIQAKYHWMSESNWGGGAAHAGMVRVEMLRLLDDPGQGSEPNPEPTPTPPQPQNEAAATEPPTEPTSTPVGPDASLI